MTTSAAKLIADRYIARDGGAPVENCSGPLTSAELAWQSNAEVVQRALRSMRKLTKAEAAEALSALGRIGDAIAADEKIARGGR
jgi:hypothetical protein